MPGERVSHRRGKTDETAPRKRVEEFIGLTFGVNASCCAWRGWGGVGTGRGRIKA